MILHYTLGLFFLVSRIGSGLGENCFYYGKSSGSMNYMYCSKGCCGDYYNQYCCVNAVGIVGGVISFLFFVVIIIAISCLCCGCCQSSRRSFVGTVFRTNRNPPMRTIGYVQQPVYGQPYVIQNAGYHSVQTQSPAGNIVYIQGDAKAGYPTGPATYQAAQAPPPYMA